MKHEIEIPDLPEGWEAVAYRVPDRFIEDMVLYKGQIHRCTNFAYDNREFLIVRKKQPRRIVLEETDMNTCETGCTTLENDGVTIDVYAEKKYKIVEDDK